jgi:glycosyltransferase involved in cell wall biosynthesis
MGKIKVLVLSMDMDGVGNYRMNAPYLTIHDDGLDIDLKTTTDNTVNILDENYIKRYQIIVHHKSYPVMNEQQLITYMGLIKKFDIKLIFDIDDYWILDHTHINYKKWIKSGSKDKVESYLKMADYVTTTTPILADEIKHVNPNVEVFENAVNHKEQQWIPNKSTSDKTRFIWGGGITHLPDLKLLIPSIEQFNKKDLNEIQMVMCGFDMRMTSNTKILKDDPNRSMWGKFEDIFTNKLKWIKNHDYRNWLKEYTDIKRDLYGYNDQYKSEFYQRRWTKPILLYGTMYNEADVALAPLKATQFNKMKSQLKVLEAGAHKMPIIASNFGAYQLDIIDGKHGFLINESDKRGWYDKIRYFIDNPNAVEDMGNELHSLIMEKYTLEKINNKRIEFLKRIIN